MGTSMTSKLTTSKLNGKLNKTKTSHGAPDASFSKNTQLQRSEGRKTSKEKS